MPNNSSTGGYLLPTGVNGDLEDAALREFLQQVIVGVTGLPATLVKPAWQREPPAIQLNPGTNWASFRIVSTNPDTFAYVEHQDSPTEQDVVYRQEELEILVRFQGDNSQQYAETFTIGLQVAQNREAMQLAGFGFVNTEKPVCTPEQDNNVWVYGWDVRWNLRRGQLWSYAVLDLLSAQGTLNFDTPPASYPLQISSEE